MSEQTQTGELAASQAHSAAHGEAHAEGHAHSVSYGTYFMVWLGLVALTAVTVTIAGIHLGSLTLITAMLIASVKTALVGYHFMHLKYDNVIIKVFVLVCLVIFLTFWILTFSDLSFR
ncbi:MAG: cytochrome C oxidase subunit IV family protein [Ignavibacteria bacterium]|nr:cytochrome C oxidase subunit IV family protein [Ignavibacteriales bacterium]MBN8583917.1 cytochrome C oxidase subunit IV family protein [Ignavibacteria bacterium]